MIVTPDVTLTYTNTARKSIKLGWDTPFVVHPGNRDNQRNNVYGTPIPNRHGERMTGSRADRKHIRLTGEVRRGLNPYTAETMLNEAFNITIGGILEFFNSRTRKRFILRCNVSEKPVMEWNQSRSIWVYEVMLESLEPFWEGQSTTFSITNVRPMWRYPMTFPRKGAVLRRAMLFAKQTSGTHLVFENEGNVVSGFTAILTVRSGTVTNPSIIDLTTGNRIRLLYTMQPQDEIILDIHPNRRAITINGVNALHLLDDVGSYFFLIAPGQNDIGYTADENITNLFVRIRYTPLSTFAGGV